MTRHQEAIKVYLVDNPGRIVSGYELRDAVSPSASVKAIHVQIHKMRAVGFTVNSAPGPHGGYYIGDEA